jgi:outer membrane protein TolC
VNRATAVFGLALVVAPGVSVGQPGGVRDLSLVEALALAGAAGEPIAIASADLERAIADTRRAGSQRWPQLVASGAYTRTLRSEFEDLEFDFGGDPDGGEGLGDLPFGQENRYDLGLSVDQSLWSGGRIAAEVRAAEALRASAEVGVAAARAEVALTVVAAYFDAALAERLLAIATASLAQAERAHEHAKVAFEVGDAAEFDLLRAQVARDNERPGLARRRSDHKLAELRLKQLLDLPPQQTLRLTTSAPDATITATGSVSPSPPPPAADAQAVASWVARRAPVRQAEAGLRAQEELVRVARAARRPIVGLSSDYGRVAYPLAGTPSWSDARDNGTVGVGFSVPLFLGGRLRADEAVARAEVDAAAARLRQLRELATLEALEALERLAAADEVWSAAQGSVGQAARAFEIAEVRYREGISTQLELDDARLLLAQAEANRAVAARDLQVARARVELLPDLPLGAASAAPQSSQSFAPDRSGGR